MKFKVGQKVRCVDVEESFCAQLNVGGEYTVTKAYGNHVDLAEIYEPFWCASRFVPIDDPSLDSRTASEPDGPITIRRDGVRLPDVGFDADVNRDCLNIKLSGQTIRECGLTVEQITERLLKVLYSLSETRPAEPKPEPTPAQAGIARAVQRMSDNGLVGLYGSRDYEP